MWTALTPTTGHERLITAARTVDPDLAEPAVRELEEIPLVEPNRLRRALARHLGRPAVLTGTLERRLLTLAGERDGAWTLADLSGQPHASRAWPGWTHGHLRLDQPDHWVSAAALSPAAVRRLTRPRVLLVTLYHPEYFPLPRFPLAISDLARAARAGLSGQVELMDMQLGVELNDIHNAVEVTRPDILGISATFGQHDLMTRLLDDVTSPKDPPLLLAGGSLTVRNEALLLRRYPSLLIARGAGEPTIADVIAHWHGDLDLPQVRGIGYTGAPRGAGTLGIGRRRTATVANRAATDVFPELDLLDATFTHRGVAQLETSRGCTSYCSFCPRGHKGTWAGTAPAELPPILSAMRAIFDRHPEVSRTLYLVDEEFIGRGDDAMPRALAVAETVHQAGFAWETSCRIDQVVRPDTDRDWHIDRAHLWRELRTRGLRRCLFGVESGVTSILNRFAKETTGEQNALAIRTLSALGVPTRFTYITFDHLMSADELRATHAFQARTDLLLRPLPEVSVEEIVDGVRDESFVAEHATGQPLYTGISYMLVSMECLIGAAYTRAVENAGLAGTARPAMGRVDADFADWRIGSCAEHAQLWVDRNFALDYTLKSLEKILDSEPGRQVRAARRVIKDAAFAILTRMLDLAERFPTQPTTRDRHALNAGLTGALDAELATLAPRLASTVQRLTRTLPDEHARLLAREYDTWSHHDGWRLINAADPCGT